MCKIHCIYSRKHICNDYGNGVLGFKRPGYKETIVDVNWERRHLEKGYKPIHIAGKQICRIFPEGEYAVSMSCSACHLYRCRLYFKLLNDHWRITYKKCS